MNLTGWTAAEVATLFAVGAAVITGLYLLRMRRREVVVPFAALWQRVTRESDARRLWRRLRRLISWLVQLLILGAICLALGDPRPDVWLRDPVTLAIVIDRSASMAGEADPSDRSEGTGPTGEGAPARETRLDRALARARAEIAALGPSDRALVIAAGAEVATVAPLGRDPSALLSGLQDLAPTPGEADLGRALALARHAVDGQPGPKILLLTDGAVDDAGVKAIRGCAEGPIACVVDRSGGPAENLAITAFAARRYPDDREKVEVLAEVQNLGDRAARVILEVQADGLGIGRRELALEPGESKREILPELDAARSRLQARLLPVDDDPASLAALGPPSDDLAHAVVPPLRPLEVALVTDGTDLFLEAALLTLDDHVRLSGVPVAEASPDHPAIAGADLVIYDPGPEPMPAALSPKNAVFFDPWRHPESPSPIARGRDVARPFLTEQSREHPILEHIVLKDVNIRRGTTFELEPGDEVLVRTLGDPIVVLRAQDASTLAVGFDLRQSDLALRTAFPVLVANIIAYFERSAPGFVASVPVGARRPLAVAELGLQPEGLTTLEVHTPGADGIADPDRAPELAPVQDGVVRLRATQPGLYRLRAVDGATAGAEVWIAVNQANVAASDLHDRLGDLPEAQRAGEAPIPAPLTQGPLWTLLILVAAIALALEWASYHRRWTV
ncbi:MAG: VWA domain-containing protein [Nannocystaceae bacterium]